ncbi:hypothetical protein [Polyangium mundeleinium]|uniref:Uncharacterized protein n=1 Tax=Polyangium mundeleinium TaxID=2995306 RepID=A0ABT5EZU7_9BACT|nr:hypothetical protein [Polyangium mundeleinium]MDC0747301.1 hypothetical protein [Polyangium mundeleinium]
METFRWCGWPAWVILLFAILGLGLAALGFLLALMKRPLGGAIVGGVALLVSLGSIGMGPVGAMLGRSMTDQALQGDYIDASQRALIRETGYAEADGCKDVGLALGTTPFLFSLGALVLGIVLHSRKKS